MMELPDDPIGGAWLARTANLMPYGQLPVYSQIGGRRSTQVQGQFRLETHQESARPPSTIAAHLQFHLRHEVPHFEFLARLFHYIGPYPIETWVHTEPTGQYARRAAYLYEWLTGEELEVPARIGGNYLTSSPTEIKRFSGGFPPQSASAL